MSQFISVALINAPIAALLGTLVVTTTNPITFYAAIFYALMVGLSGLASLKQKKG